MPFILVADDSATDRQLIGGLLKRDIEWIVDFADDGEKAMEMIADVTPDLVITDLQMPKLDGLELCRRSRGQFPQIPVVLITGKGSEGLAAEALAAGAASYVPKSAMAQSLADTVEQVLALSDAQKSKDRLMTMSTSTRHQFSLETDPHLIPQLVDFVCDAMKLLKVGDESVIRHVAVAVEEAMLNAMMHGNLDISTEESHGARHALHEGTFKQWLEMHGKSADDRRVKFATDISRSKVQFVIRDEGKGFDKSAFESASEPAHLSEAGGRGLSLICNFMNEVTFNEAGNEIRMTLNV
jgi:CheY-like chemotaxis protein/anti-sigma regulatory factor (Ser/Thr protein kinase)